jgi:N-acetylmuramoyl-L-alanine amidase
VTRFKLIVSALVGVNPIFTVAAQSTATVAKPCVIAIDIGHSDSSPGSTSARGVAEHVFNASMGQALLLALRARGYVKSFVIDPNMTGGLPARTKAAHDKGAAALISIHHDSVQPQYLSRWTFSGKEARYSDRFNGHSLFISTKNADAESSLLLAKLIGRQFLALGLRPTLHHAEPIPGESRQLLDRRLGVYRFDDLIILRTATMPAVLLEFGVIVNREEERRLSTASYRTQLSGAVADGVRTFCGRLQVP